MATSRIILPIKAPILPDGSDTGNNPAPWEKVVSVGSQTSNSPKLSYYQHLFDSAVDSHVMWAFRVPGDYISGGTIVLTWGAKGNSGNVVWKAALESTPASSVDLDAAAFNAVVTSTATAVPAVVGQVKSTSIVLTTTGMAAGDMVVLFAGRDADNASDTASTLATLVAATFTYES